MCLGSRSSSERDHSRRSRSRSGGQSSRSRGRQDDYRSQRYERSSRHGENPNGHDYRPSRRDYPHTPSSQSRGYPSRHDPHDRSREYPIRNDPYRNGNHSAYRRDGSDYRNRDDTVTGASRAPRGTRLPRESGPPSYQPRPTRPQTFQPTEPGRSDRRPPSDDRPAPTAGRGSREGASRYGELHARPAKPPLPPSLQEIRAQVPSRLRRPDVISNLETHVGPQQRIEGIPFIDSTAYTATATEYRGGNPVSVVPDLSAVNKALEALCTSPGVTAATSCEGTSDDPAQKSWFDELTYDEQQTAFDLVKLDIERVFNRTGFPYLKSLFSTHVGMRDWLRRLPSAEQASMVQYKFGSKEAFSRRMATDNLWRVEDWKRVLPEIVHSDFRAAWFIKSRAPTLLSCDIRTEAAEREKVDRQPFHKKALESSEYEVRTVIALLNDELAKPANSQGLSSRELKAKEWAVTEGLRRTYGPKHLTSHRPRNAEP